MFNLSLRAILASALALAVVIAAASMWIFGWGFFQRETADHRGETGVVEEVSGDADYRIAAYEHFYDLCAAVQTKEAEIEAAQTELDSTNPSDYRKQQLNTNITALTSARAELINEYNADAAKEDTKANFLASDLPHQLDIEQEHTECTAN